MALVLAVEQVINGRDEESLFEGRVILPFLAFVALSFSIYHWGVTYLDRRYAAGRGASVSRTGVFVDLVVGTTELLALVGLSILLSRPPTFAIGVAIVLVFEVIAGLVLRAAGNYEALGRFPRTYLWLNLATAASLGLALLASELLSPATRALVSGPLVCVASVARAALFYGLGFEILFGEPATA